MRALFLAALLSAGPALAEFDSESFDTESFSDEAFAFDGGGDPTVEVPSVLGMDEATADAAFEGVGLDTGAVFETCSEEDLGVVVIQIPPSGAQAAPGSTVDIFLSTGVACVGRPGGTRHGFGFGFGVQ